ncbi:MAG: hypothetical protein RIQ52_774 [Pseudomonadota bacterium]
MPGGIWVLGLVSLFMDISSEMIHSLLPVFMVTVLGSEALTIGLIEGVAESTAMIVKIFSGVLSDYLGRRKWIAVAGYGLGAITKPLFAIATSADMILAARFLDRTGKGIRGAPRDALIADLAPPAIRGAAFGLRQTLDTVGAFTGPLLAVLLMLVWHDDFRLIFWIALLPGLLSVGLLALGIREPADAGHGETRRTRENPLTLAKLGQLNRAYWWVVMIGAVFTLARFSEAFLVLRAMESGIPAAWIPMVMVFMNVIYALSAYPMGVLSDHMDHRWLLVTGLLLLVAADLLLAVSPDCLFLFSGMTLWGLHMGMTQGLMAKLVADTAPATLRGSAYGCFNMVSGIAMLLASTLAGAIWDGWGAGYTFHAGAGFCVLALLLVLLQPAVASSKNQIRSG